MVSLDLYDCVNIYRFSPGVPLEHLGTEERATFDQQWLPASTVN